MNEDRFDVDVGDTPAPAAAYRKGATREDELREVEETRPRRIEPECCGKEMSFKSGPCFGCPREQERGQI